MPPPRPHPLARSRFAERLDRWLTTLIKRGWFFDPALDPEFLWAKGANGFEPADEAFARRDADRADFRERLEHLTASLRSEAQLNALGQVMAYGQIAGAIEKRHALGALWRKQPGLPETPIAPPIIVVGQMRAGTTRMQRLLAADPRHAGTRFCNAMNPVPPTPDWRPLASRAGLALARRINPWLDTLHPFGATRTDEELGWLASALDACAFEAQYRIPSYVTFNEARDPAPVYREFARILRTDAALIGDAARPRVLKCPQFAEDLPALLAQFPEARVVVTRRDTDDVLASTVSMVAAQSAFQSDVRSLVEIEDHWRGKIALRERRIDAALRSLSGPLAEVDFAALNVDRAGVIAQVYRDLGLDLTEEARGAIEAEAARSSKGPHRAHRRQLQRFGSEAAGLQAVAQGERR